MLDELSRETSVRIRVGAFLIFRSCFLVEDRFLCFYNHEASLRSNHHIFTYTS